MGHKKTKANEMAKKKTEQKLGFHVKNDTTN